MTISNSFRNFSLAELFQLIDQGRKSGCLTVWTSAENQDTDVKGQYYVWFIQGRLVAVTNSLTKKDLASRISDRGWLSSPFLEKYSQKLKPGKPLGLSLKTQGMLKSDQLNLLFSSQIQQVKKLFEIQKGVFKLDSKAPVPWQELTGLSISTIEVALMTLRDLKNWENLAEALPEKDSGIKVIPYNQPQVRLNYLELQLLEWAQGTVSLKAIAKQINKPIDLIQQAAFRLMIADLVEEIPLVTSMPSLSDDGFDFSYINASQKENTKAEFSYKSKSNSKSKVSTSFMENLFGFLRSTV
jgi:Domain of unknown function (DUF4388)